MRLAIGPCVVALDDPILHHLGEHQVVDVVGCHTAPLLRGDYWHLGRSQTCHVADVHRADKAFQLHGFHQSDLWAQLLELALCCDLQRCGLDGSRVMVWMHADHRTYRHSLVLKPGLAQFRSHELQVGSHTTGQSQAGKPEGTHGG